MEAIEVLCDLITGEEIRWPSDPIFSALSYPDSSIMNDRISCMERQRPKIRDPSRALGDIRFLPEQGSGRKLNLFA